MRDEPGLWVAVGPDARVVVGELLGQRGGGGPYCCTKAMVNCTSGSNAKTLLEAPR
jgi:hypothetical protein